VIDQNHPQTALAGYRGGHHAGRPGPNDGYIKNTLAGVRHSS
jgi:hypothetical protein